MLRAQSEAARQLVTASMPSEAALAEWGEAAERLQAMWFDFHQGSALPEPPAPFLADPAQWMGLMQAWYQQIPLLDPERQRQLWHEGIELWHQILEQFGIGPDGEMTAAAPKTEPTLPRQDRRFADPAWRQQPVFALIHQTYLLLAERLGEMVDEVGGLESHEREQLRFALKSVLDAMSPANFPLTNPVVLERTLETHGANLIRGIERLTADLEKGQLTHTDASAFKLGENIACTPGKVVHETELYQLIQYSPATDEVLEIPVVIFPPWINRFYILDLNPKKSFVKWAVEQGLTVFMVSWRSADESLAHVVWDDYIRAEIEAIDFIRERLGVPAVHAVGYCVAGTTLAATLAILARRDEADKVRSATFLTAQVDFERAGDLKLFVDDTQLELIRQASKGGYLDGRYMAATFNMLRGADLIWNYVVNYYLLGEDYPAFDLLYWNGDVTNLPAKWHESYLRDLYRDNRLVQPDAMTADRTPIDLNLVETPAYIQAGREDHIAPPESVWRLTEHFSGPMRFVLAGSGHIAGVVNPPSARKYQYWTNDTPADSLEAFVKGAQEHPGSWWTDWLEWLESFGGTRVKATGKRKPGGRGDRAIEDAPGRYVAMR
ncbi:MAG: class I poly(R)-hydroxyalkanoic acid synthase [Porphyrobacter sp.]|nr:class I poly(R)-hydroxyalkanoic acid synthase [Porphyrobacter sp.]